MNITSEEAMKAIRRLQKQPLSKQKPCLKEDQGRYYRNTIPEIKRKDKS